ncbi:MAG: 2-amino-4-hydroxy-6-hydroxymethyldihydropteridine diphosphokinase [Bacteroidaceae bacterium]|nr:2-amino-4-hydroxy-6-hydroxymethyldihydropteridine diphosphokinase [Bacteroidaceae bacterium]
MIDIVPHRSFSSHSQPKVCVSAQLYISLGSNLGDSSVLLRQAIDLLGEHVGVVERVSDFIQTEPWGFRSDHNFWNACCRIRTELTPHQCLEATQRIERQLGRTHKSHDGVYHDRTIDIDLLMYDDLHVNEPDLTLPHPLMHERDFVMIPLRQVLGED